MHDELSDVEQSRASLMKWCLDQNEGEDGPYTLSEKDNLLYLGVLVGEVRRSPAHGKLYISLGTAGRGQAFRLRADGTYNHDAMRKHLAKSGSLESIERTAGARAGIRKAREAAKKYEDYIVRMNIHEPEMSVFCYAASDQVVFSVRTTPEDAERVFGVICQLEEPCVKELDWIEVDEGCEWSAKGSMRWTIAVLYRVRNGNMYRLFQDSHERMIGIFPTVDECKWIAGAIEAGYTLKETYYLEKSDGGTD